MKYVNYFCCFIEVIAFISCGAIREEVKVENGIKKNEVPREESILQPSLLKNCQRQSLIMIAYLLRAQLIVNIIPFGYIFTKRKLNAMLLYCLILVFTTVRKWMGISNIEIK